MRTKENLETLVLDESVHEFLNDGDTREVLEGYRRGFYSATELAYRLEYLSKEALRRAEKKIFAEQELDENACDCGCSDVEVVNCWIDDPCHECAGCSERRVCEAEDRFEEGA